ncbi:MAG: hypothetical protein ACRENE_25360, partial [Polyangiaceae bacterium]
MGLQGAGPPGGAETVFLDSVARAADVWKGLLASPAHLPTIASEASELAGVARIRGFTEVGDLLTRIQKLAVAQSGDVAAALGQLTAWLSSRRGPAAPLDRTVVMPQREPSPPPPLAPAPLASPQGAPGAAIPLPPMLDMTSSHLQG